MSSTPQRPQRTVKTRQDLGAIEANSYNDSAGAKKVIIIQPDIVRATLASENVGAGRYVKINAASYGLDLVGMDFSSALIYNKGSMVAQAGSVYMCNEDNVTGAFDDQYWIKVAQQTITGIPCVAGDVVTTGRYHNAVTVAGFLVDDDSIMDYTRVRN